MLFRPLLWPVALAVGFLVAQAAAAAPPVIEGPATAAPGQALDLAVLGIEAPDLATATLGDLAAWLKTVTVAQSPPIGPDDRPAPPASIRTELVLTLAGVEPRLRFTATEQGEYVLVVVDPKRPGLDSLGFKRIRIGPKPDPKPDPKPNPPPIPTAGFRALIIYEQSATLTKEQRAILTGSTVRDFLAQHCTRGPAGRPEFRIYDPDIDLQSEAPIWREAMAQPRGAGPWLIVSNGLTGYSGPLPADPPATVALLQKYLPPATTEGP